MGVDFNLLREFVMPKQLMKISMERDSLQQKWGITIQGGSDLALTAKIASVKRFSPADRAGPEKMDYIWTINGKEVFGMTQPQITGEIVNSQLSMEMEYILEAMQHHGLGHLPQPDNFTTCGRLGIEINQY